MTSRTKNFTVSVAQMSSSGVHTRWVPRLSYTLPSQASLIHGSELAAKGAGHPECRGREQSHEEDSEHEERVKATSSLQHRQAVGIGGQVGWPWRTAPLSHQAAYSSLALDS